MIKEAESGKVIADMSHENRREVILRGGRGGKGDIRNRIAPLCRSGVHKMHNHPCAFNMLQKFMSECRALRGCWDIPILIRKRALNFSRSF